MEALGLVSCQPEQVIRVQLEITAAGHRPAVFTRHGGSEGRGTDKRFEGTASGHKIAEAVMSVLPEAQVIRSVRSGSASMAAIFGGLARDILNFQPAVQLIPALP